jgi:hypothetical protein
MPPAARDLFEKRFLDFQKLLIKIFAGGPRGAVFLKRAPLAAGGMEEAYGSIYGGGD